MHRNERFGRGRGPRGRADEGRFGSEGWRGGSGQGFDHEGGRRFANRGEYGRGHGGGEDYRGMSRGGYPGYGAGDAAASRRRGRAGVRTKISDMAEANRARVFREAGAKANSVEPRKRTGAITTTKTTITGATNNCGNSTKTMTSGETNAGRSSRRTSTNGVHPGRREPKDRGQPVRQT